MFLREKVVKIDILRYFQVAVIVVPNVRRLKGYEIIIIKDRQP